MEVDREDDKDKGNSSSLSHSEEGQRGSDSDVETETEQQSRKDFRVCLNQLRNPPDSGIFVATTLVSASLSQSLASQPPGPSGIDLCQFPAVPTLSSVSVNTEPNSDDEGHVVPLEDGGREREMPSTETPTASLMFQVSPSQDVLNQEATQDNLGFSNESMSMAPYPHGSATLGPSFLAVTHCRPVLVPQNNDTRGSSKPPPPNYSYTQHEISLLAENLVQQSEQERLAAEQRQQNQLQGLVEYLSRHSECEPPLERNPQDSGVGAGSGQGGGGHGGGDGGGSNDAHGSNRGGMSNRLLTRHGGYVVPRSEGTDLSSDDSVQQALGAFARERRERHLATVPQSSLATTRVISCHGDQAVHLTTTDSDTTAPERSRGQKVPSFSSRKMLELSEEAAKMKETSYQATDSRTDEVTVKSPLCPDIGTTTTTTDVSSSECSFEGLASSSTDISSKKFPFKRLAAGPPISGAATGESSHDPATQTTSSDASEASHNLSPLWKQGLSSPILPSPPLAKQSPSPPPDNPESISPASEVVPSTLPSERPTIMADGQSSIEPHIELENQLPNWYNRLQDEAMSPTRPGSSSSSESDNDKSPPLKRKRDESRRSSSSDIPGWQREANSDMQATGQARPMVTFSSTSSKQFTSSSHFSGSLQLTDSGSSVQPFSSPHTGSSGPSLESVLLSTNMISSSGSSTFSSTAFSKSSTSSDQPPSSPHSGSAGDGMLLMGTVSQSCAKNAETQHNTPCTSNSQQQKPNSGNEVRTTRSLVPLERHEGTNVVDRPSQLLNDLFSNTRSSDESQLDVYLPIKPEKQLNILSDCSTTLCDSQSSVEDADINSPPRMSTPRCEVESGTGNDGAIDLENTEDTWSSQTQLADSLELIQDKFRIPLLSPMKLPHLPDSVSESGSGLGDQGTEAMDDTNIGGLERVKAESETSLQLHLTQSQDLSSGLFTSLTARRMSGDSSLAIQSDENLNRSSSCILIEQNLDKTSSGGIGGGSDGRGGGGCKDRVCDGGNDIGAGDSGDGVSKDRVRGGDDIGTGDSGDGGSKDRVCGGDDIGTGDGGGGVSKDRVRGGDDIGTGDSGGGGSKDRVRGSDDIGTGDGGGGSKDHVCGSDDIDAGDSGGGGSKDRVCGGVGAGDVGCDRSCKGEDATHGGNGGSDSGANAEGGGGSSVSEDKVKDGDGSVLNVDTVGGSEQRESKLDKAVAVREEIQYNVEDVPEHGPAPLYESLDYGDSVESSGTNDARILSSSPSTLLPTTAKNNSQIIDISQICSSGANFEFQLPHDSMLQPVTCITPPCKDPPLPFPMKSTTRIIGTSDTDSENRGKLSPSAVSTDFFTRSVTPSSVPQRDAAVSQFEGNIEMQCSSITNNVDKHDGCDELPSSTASGAVDDANSSPIVPPRTTSLTYNGTVVTADSPNVFQLGTPECVQEPEVDYSSPPLLPLIDVPSDSQFDFSEDTELHFIVPKHSLNRSMTSYNDSDKNARLTIKSLFSDVVANKRQKVEAVRSMERHEEDPYMFNSDSQGSSIIQAVVGNTEKTCSSDQKEMELPLDVEHTAKKKLDELPISNDVAPISIEMESNVSPVPVTLPKPSVLISSVSQSGRFCLPLLTSPTTCSPAPLLRTTLSTANRLSPGLPGSLHSPMHTQFPRHSLPSPNLSTISPEFVSPSRAISSEGYLELKKHVEEQEGKAVEVEAHELRYIHTVCTVTEERFISSEVVKNGVVVAESEKFWPELSRPYTTQEVRVELLPRISSGSSLPPSTPSIILSPFICRYTSSPTSSASGQFKVRSPSSIHLLPSPGYSGNTSGNGHALHSDLSISHRSEDSSLPWKDISNNVGELKLSGVPTKYRYSDSSGATTGDVSSDTIAKVAGEGLVTEKVCVGGPGSSTACIIEDDTVFDGSCSLDEEEVFDGVSGCDVSCAMHEESPMPFSAAPLSRRGKGGMSVSPLAVCTSLPTPPTKSLEKQRRTLSTPARVSKQDVYTKARRMSANVRVSIQRSPLNFRIAKGAGARSVAVKAEVGEAFCISAPESEEETGSGSLAYEENNDGVGVSDVSHGVNEEAAIPFTTPLSRKGNKTRLTLHTPLRKRRGEQRSTLSAPTKVSKKNVCTRAKRMSANVRVCIQRTPCVKKLCLDKTTPRRSNNDGVHEESRIDNTLHCKSPEVGEAVIARWLTDKRWYAATVSGSKNGKIILDYADGEKGSVTPHQFFSQNLLTVNEPVMARPVADEALPEINGSFEGFCENENEKSFCLRMTGGRTVTCNTSCFSISQDTALKYVGQSRTSPLSRKRLSRQFSEPSPLTKKRKNVSLSPSHRCFQKDLSFEDLVSPSQRHLFQGYTFFLTQKLKEDKRSRTPDDTVVNKQEMSALIVNRKGKILETYKDEKVTDGSYFVVSDDCCRTQKYLLGLALAIPCISYTWITDCIKQGTVLDHVGYRLPAGIPHRRTTPIKWTPRERSSILKGVQVYLHHHQNSFKEQWKYVVKYSGAKNLTKLPNANKMRFAQDIEGHPRGCEDNPLDIVVVSTEDCKFPASLNRYCSLYKVMVLSTEWVVQCLVQGRKVDNYQDFVVKLKH